MQCFRGSILLFIATLLCFSCRFVFGAECKNNFPHAFDVGYYWAKPTAGKLEWTKSCPDLDVMSANFDPDKPSVIISHGLQPDMIKEETQFGLDGMLDDVLKGWIWKGYNVGVFLWTCFADERVMNFVYSEDQIYTTNGFVKMRYKVKDDKGRIRVLFAPQNMSVSDYFVEQWKFHFKEGRTYGPVTLVGHSLGTQVTLLSAYKIVKDDDISTKPDRLALLDAVMSPADKMYLENNPCGESISKVMGCMAKELNLAHDIAIEYYKSSFINRCLFSSNEFGDLIKYVAYSIVEQHYFGMHPLGSCWDKDLLHNIDNIKHYGSELAYQINWQHVFIVPYYLMSIWIPPHRCVASPDEQNCTLTQDLALSAAMSRSEVLAWSRPLAPDDPATKMCFKQYDECDIAGRQMEGSSTMTLTSEDDMFYLKKCIHAHT